MRAHLPIGTRWCLPLIAAVFFSAACQKETPPPSGGEDSPSAVQTVEELVRRRDAGQYLEEVRRTADGLVLTFPDGEAVLLSDAAFHPVGEEPRLGLSDRGEWLLDGTKTGIFLRVNSFDPEKEPVCCLYAEGILTVWLDTGALLVLVHEPRQLLSSLVFTRKDNPNLNADVRTRQEGTAFRGTARGFPASALVPEFRLAGQEVLCDGTPVVSGQTRIPVDGTVVLSVTGYDGLTYRFTLDLDRETVTFPCIRIWTQDGSPVTSKTEYRAGTFRFEDPDQLYSDTPLLTGALRIRGRGNSTWNLAKKPYRLKLEAASPVFGMPRNKDWILLANHYDKSLLRNRTAFRLSEICGMPWTPASRVVEVWLNGGYVGCYDLVQHKEVAGKKVDIDLARGDCYLELGEMMDEPVCFYSPVYRVPVMFKDPQDPTPEVKGQVTGVFRQLEEALSGDRFADPEDGYAAYFDLPSLVNYYIIQELSKNIDGNLRRSTFLTTGPERKLTFCHVWDFDLAFGNSNRISLEFPGATPTSEGWYIRSFGRLGQGTGWFPRLFQDPAFVEAVRQRWNELRPALETLPDYIRSEQEAYGYAFRHNFERWDILGHRLGPQVEVFSTYEEEVDYLVRFYTERLAWLDRQINRL